MLACLCGHDCLLADAFAARQTLLSSWEINCVGRPYLQLHTYTSTSSGPMVLVNKYFSMICAKIMRAYQTPLLKKFYLSTNLYASFSFCGCAAKETLTPLDQIWQKVPCLKAVDLGVPNARFFLILTSQKIPWLFGTIEFFRAWFFSQMLKKACIKLTR